MTPIIFTMAEIEEREELIASRSGIRNPDRMWLRLEAMKELRMGIPADPVRSTKTIDDICRAALDRSIEPLDRDWSPAQICRRAS